MEKDYEIHPMALVDSRAKIGKGVKIGPFCCVGPDVELGENTVLLSHVVIEGHTKIGKNNTFHQFCAIGTAPQDTSYKGEDTRVEIGDNNLFREYVSVHRATLKQDKITIIGNNNMFMAKVHIGHDVVIENGVRLVNSCNLAGHVHICNNVIIGGGTNIAQFIKLGRGSYVGGASGIDKDIPPFCTAYGNRVHLKGINIIGLRRQGHPRDVISGTIDFYKAMENSTFSPRAFVDRMDLMEEFSGNPLVKEMSDFIRKSETGTPQFF
jgi:UDP-N-acetylglucosamine acyltransferase